MRRVEVLVTSLIRRATAGHAVFVGTTGENEWPAGCPYASRTICSKPNYFVQQSNLERIRDFVNVLLVSIGVPQVAPVAPNPALQGYSWPAFVDVCIGTDGQAQGRVGPRPGEAEGRRPGIQGNTTSLYASPFEMHNCRRPTRREKALRNGRSRAPALRAIVRLVGRARAGGALHPQPATRPTRAAAPPRRVGELHSRPRERPLLRCLSQWTTQSRLSPSKRPPCPALSWQSADPCGPTTPVTS